MEDWYLLDLDEYYKVSHEAYLYWQYDEGELPQNYPRNNPVYFTTPYVQKFLYAMRHERSNNLLLYNCILVGYYNDYSTIRQNTRNSFRFSSKQIHNHLEKITAGGDATILQKFTKLYPKGGFYMWSINEVYEHLRVLTGFTAPALWRITLLLTYFEQLGIQRDFDGRFPPAIVYHLGRWFMGKKYVVAHIDDLIHDATKYATKKEEFLFDIFDFVLVVMNFRSVFVKEKRNKFNYKRDELIIPERCINEEIYRKSYG